MISVAEALKPKTELAVEGADIPQLQMVVTKSFSVSEANFDRFVAYTYNRAFSIGECKEAGGWKRWPQERTMGGSFHFPNLPISYFQRQSKGGVRPRHDWIDALINTWLVRGEHPPSLPQAIVEDMLIRGLLEEGSYAIEMRPGANPDGRTPPPTGAVELEARMTKNFFIMEPDFNRFVETVFGKAFSLAACLALDERLSNMYKRSAAIYPRIARSEYENLPEDKLDECIGGIDALLRNWLDHDTLDKTLPHAVLECLLLKGVLEDGSYHIERAEK